jgi:[glutamine synthetase] adenylyltransferase / [glutamine synthetase]-adenylyl-L-tyrosine phosphorylase
VTLPPFAEHFSWILEPATDSLGGPKSSHGGKSNDRQQVRFRDPVAAVQSLEALQMTGVTTDSLVGLLGNLRILGPQLSFPDQTIEHLTRTITGVPNPPKVVSTLAESIEGFRRLVKTLDGGPAIANRISSDPAVAIRIIDDQSFGGSLESSLDELNQSLLDVSSASRAASLLRQWHSRQLILTAAHERTADLSPIEIGRRLSDVADAVVEAALQNAMHRTVEIRGMPTRSDGTVPAVTVLATGALGARELSYTSPFRLIFLFDSIDHRNVYHRQFYEAMVQDLVQTLGGDPSRRDTSIDIDLRENPRHEVGAPICGFFDAIRIYETSGRLDQRLRFTKARVVAGSHALGDALVERLKPWIYRQYLTRSDLAEASLMRRKLERLNDRQGKDQIDILGSPGGRTDIERTIGFLQLMHGAALTSVRRGGTADAIDALRAGGCLSLDESSLLAENHARLCRLQNQIWITLGTADTRLPTGPDLALLASALGLQTDGVPDTDRFETALRRTMQRNRDTINHLVVGFGFGDQSSAAETELVLDPDPDPEMVARTMRDHGIKNSSQAMSSLASLATESVRFLSPHRCRHFFSMIAPALLDEIGRTPDPDQTLDSLVQVTDSLGAKASLWELLGSNHPTMKLLVRLCAAAPYLSRILVNNPGMIDELIDSLLMNRLPSTGRMDAHSIEVCRGAADIDLILRGFKNSSHLTIGVRDILGKESLEATHAAIGDVAEACIRRGVEFQYDQLAEQYGDPVDANDELVQPIVVAVGKLGGREPNYHSDLELIFLYSQEGQTRRRVGGPRSTCANRQFFDLLASAVMTHLSAGPDEHKLYNVISRLGQEPSGLSQAMSVAEYFEAYRSANVSAETLLMLCKARPISGSKEKRREVELKIETALSGVVWNDTLGQEIRHQRLCMQEGAGPGNLKRGIGGTVDVEFVAAAMMLKVASQNFSLHRRGTTDLLASLGRGGIIEPADADDLIDGYRTLRRVEANLRLMATQARHDLPSDEATKVNLAYLMKEPNPETIWKTVDQARAKNRQLFNKYLPET